MADLKRNIRNGNENDYAYLAPALIPIPKAFEVNSFNDGFVFILFSNPLHSVIIKISLISYFQCYLKYNLTYLEWWQQSHGESYSRANCSQNQAEDDAFRHRCAIFNWGDNNLLLQNFEYGNEFKKYLYFWLGYTPQQMVPLYARLTLIEQNGNYI